MRQKQVEYLGSKKNCLKACTGTIEERIVKCNNFLKEIGKTDRKFFFCKQTKTYAEFKFVNRKNKPQLAYVDDYTKKPIFNTHLKNKCAWVGDFTSGGTLQDIVMCLSIYIKSGIPFFSWWLRVQNWGYSMDGRTKIMELSESLGIVTNTLRHMIYQRVANETEAIKTILKENNVNTDSYIILHTYVGKSKPYWVGEFNFMYKSIR